MSTINIVGGDKEGFAGITLATTKYGRLVANACKSDHTGDFDEVSIGYYDKDSGEYVDIARAVIVPDAADPARFLINGFFYNEEGLDKTDYTSSVNITDLDLRDAFSGPIEVVEVCPHCENENVFTNWQPGKGFVKTCQHCGQPIFLCSECPHHLNDGKCDEHQEGNFMVCDMGRYEIPKKKFSVTCSRTINYEWVVEANSKEEAERIARDMTESMSKDELESHGQKGYLENYEAEETEED